MNALDHLADLAAEANRAAERFGPDHPAALAAALELARELGAYGHPTEAATRARELKDRAGRALGRRHPLTLTCDAVARTADAVLGADPTEAAAAVEQVAADVGAGTTGARGRSGPRSATDPPPAGAPAAPEDPVALALAGEAARLRLTAASLRLTAGDLHEAALLADQALPELAAARPPTDRVVLAGRLLAGWVRLRRGPVDKAVAGADALVADATLHLGPEHLVTFGARHLLAAARATGGDTTTAEAEATALASLAARSLGAGHPEALTARHLVAQLDLARGRPEEAAAELARVRAGRAEWFGAASLPVHLTALDEAEALAIAGETAAAVELLEPALPVLQRARRDPAILARAHLLHAALLRQQGRTGAAIATLEAGLARVGQRRPLTDDSVLALRVALADTFGAAGLPGEAAARWAVIASDLDAAQGSDAVASLAARVSVARWLAANGENTEARRYLEEGLAGAERFHGPDHPVAVEARDLLDLLGTVAPSEPGRSRRRRLGRRPEPPPARH